jgi:NitT/TauT family transport system substrate-binding protein
MPNEQGRRRFVTNAAVAGVAGFGALGAVSRGGRKSFAAEPPPETTTIRLSQIPSICIAPQYVVGDLLRAEGFVDVRYEPLAAAYQHEQLARGQADFSLHFAAPTIMAIDAGKPITVIAGIHVGCFVLYAAEDIHGVVDLRGRTVGVQGLGSSSHVYVASMASYIGLNPAKDIRWVTDPAAKPMQLFLDGKVDAFLATPPEPQIMREHNVGRVIVDSSVDRPWSQYFCCTLMGNADFIRQNPVATKRVLRAFLKATDLCGSDPRRAAQIMVDGGFTDRYDYALQTLNQLPYGVWREYDPEDTMRFYALRLQEVGVIRSTPQQVIASGTDWRFLNELKRELKS